ncbi:MAG: 3-deoxy-7-phosphoheptulonate synthase [Phycisphaeraceae bacterium]|nr:3-deoxy-7-phosphoheptulonate synthase [Phycisphaeraceae bacterium]
MIVVMKPEATESDVQTVCQLVREMGLRDHVIVGTDLTVVAVIGDDRKKDKGKLELASNVDRVVPILAPYKMAAREARPTTSTVVVSSQCIFGGIEVPIVAGPCSVEGEREIIETAHLVKKAGAHALRGGAFKPRTNPYTFQGFGEDGLKMLAQAREATGLAIITEVMTPSEVDLVAEYADCLQIGTRNSQNYRLLEACGRQPRPVLLKRGMSMTIDELLQAAEYILAAGNPNVILCERGIRTFEDHTRNTFSLSAIPEIHHKSHLPIVADPSHGTGHARLVSDMAKAAVAAGADGILLEVHPDPVHAMTDGGQSITPDQLGKLVPTLGRIARAIERDVILESRAEMV